METGNNQDGSQQSNLAQPNAVLNRSASNDEAIERKVQEIMERAAFEKRTREIISNYVDSVPFMKKVQEYASEEVKRCYSTDRYQDFQKAVTDIVHAELGSDTGRQKLDAYVETKIGNILDERGWKRKNFYWPLIVSIIGAAAAVAAVIVAIIALKHH